MYSLHYLDYFLRAEEVKGGKGEAGDLKSGSDESTQPRYHIVWRNVLVLAYLHLAAVYGFFLIVLGMTYMKTIYWGAFIASTSTLAVTGGAHRLWAHRCYKANLPMRIILAAFMSTTFQNHIYEWARDHRVHHKFAETDADPHNAKRGFFFAHVGWLMVKKHRDVVVKGKTVDMSDLEQDGVVMFQKKFYPVLMVLGTFIIPTLVPWYFWNEDIYVAYYTAAIFRYIFSVNLVWCINSAAHLYGHKPYDKNIGPTQNPHMMVLGFGEGFHNYHHTFPWDYKASEFGSDIRNLTTYMIELFARIGWATELKTASEALIRSRVRRTGDGTWTGDLDALKKNFVELSEGQFKPDVWGWGDGEMNPEDVKHIKVYNKL